MSYFIIVTRLCKYNSQMKLKNKNFVQNVNEVLIESFMRTDGVQKSKLSATSKPPQYPDKKREKKQVTDKEDDDPKDKTFDPPALYS